MTTAKGKRQTMVSPNSLQTAIMRLTTWETTTGKAESSHCKGKYHCVDRLQFDGFYSSEESVANLINILRS